jgi:PAS domain S-box-containing protein
MNVAARLPVLSRAHAPRGVRALPASAALYIALLLSVAVGAVASLVHDFPLDPSDLATFCVLAAGAAVGSLFLVSSERNHGFNTALLFIAAAAVLLPPEYVALMGLAQYWPELVRRRSPWYSQLFNLANYTLDGLAAWFVLRLIVPQGSALDGASAALAIAAACVVLVAVNHVLLAVALRLARAQPLRESDLFSFRSLSTDLLLACFGATFAVVWRYNPVLAFLPLAPFALILRSFSLLELLGRSERRFRGVFESTIMGIRLTDLEGRILQTNGAFAEIVGDDPYRLLGRSVADLVDPDDLDTHDELFGELARGERDSYEVELRLLRRDGSIRCVHLTESLVRDADGAPASTIGVVRDITDKAALRARLNEAQRLEAVGKLAGGVAHDFNNLLAVIVGHSELALRSLGEDEPLRLGIGETKRAAERAAVLTKQLLAFSRRQMLRPRVVDLNGVLSGLDPLLRRLAGERVAFETRQDPTLVPIKADPAQLEQVLMNLVVNARDAMDGAGTIAIETQTVFLEAFAFGDAPLERGQYAMLALSDTGCGMDPATRERMFEPFFTTKTTSGGTGLGLATVHGIVVQSGGAITVDSASGRGTRFAIYLPAGDEREDDEADVAEALGEEEHAGKTVLLVDDEPLIREMGRVMLETDGYRVLSAGDGDAALELCRESDCRIDVLVTDVMMPGMTGRELGRQVQELRPSLPIIYMSGYSHDETDRGLVPDDMIFLAKPFTTEELANALVFAARRPAAARR